MRFWLALPLVSLVMVNTLQAGAGSFFRSAAIFPAENKHNHASCVIELANGDLLAAWYRGSGERTADDVVVQGAWLRAGGTAWGPRFTLADTPGYPDCNPALFAAPDRTIWLFWPTILDHRWEGALLKFAVARDDGPHDGPLHWSKEGVLHVTPTGFGPAMEQAIAALPAAAREAAKPALDRYATRSRDELYQRLGWMPRVHPTVLPTGRWLLPLYSDTFSASIVAISDDQGASWSVSQPMIGFGNIQPSLVRKADGSIVAFMRDNGPHKKIRMSTSRDDGQTWSAVTDSTFPNPGAGIEAIRLANGHWALVYNDAARGRHSLAITLSVDEGTTWTSTRHIERIGVGLGQFHYPSIMQSRDGTIHVTYTRRVGSEGSTIQHSAFNEDWIVEGDGPAEGSNR